jgi:beta-glucosidase
MPLLVLTIAGTFLSCSKSGRNKDQVEELINKMTLEEKIGQMQLFHSPGGSDMSDLSDLIKSGQAGAILNETRPEAIRELQQAAVEQSRLGIPLLFGRDVIHGFKTIFPINIGLAATFNPELVREGAEIAALEAASTGVNWNFTPMVDVARDPRWGRMAESFGEDPLLVSTLGLAMLQGFKGEDSIPRMATCAKHFAAYSAAEGGRDYNTTSVPRVELWNTYFKPFIVLNDAGVNTFMTGFNELNGIPATGSIYLLREILKERWQFEGFVVSDWASVVEMRTHGFAENDRDAAYKAIQAGLDMEMASTAYGDHLGELVKSGIVSEELVDDAVRRILKVKFDLGLFADPYVDLDKVIADPPVEHLEKAKESAIESLVLLKNEKETLPLDKSIKRVAVIGPMANDRYEQLGTWIFDGDTNLSITPFMAIRDFLGEGRVKYAKGLKTTRDRSRKGFNDAIRAAKNAEVSLVFVGEESIITGEAHSRAFLDLPGAQEELIMELSATGKPLVLVVMTPRPLAIGDISKYADAVLYAWHPGTMAGPALADVLFGIESPSGKLPVTFPKTAGQIPIYYAHKNTGRPADENSFVPIDEIPVRSFQTSIGNTSHYLDVGFRPLYPFGFGLSYTDFEYSNLTLSSGTFGIDEKIKVSVTLTNTGNFDGKEVVQLYVQDKLASITRPVKELKEFRKVYLTPGETKTIEFELETQDLGFYDEEGNYLIEPGEFNLWIGGSSDAELQTVFSLI